MSGEKTRLVPMLPEIGEVVRQGRTVYYAFPDGIYVEGTIEALTAKLSRPGAHGARYGS